MIHQDSVGAKGWWPFVLAVVVCGLVVGGIAILWRTFSFKPAPPQSEGEPPEGYIFSGSDRGKGTDPGHGRLFTMGLDTTGLAEVDTPGRIEDFDLSPRADSLAFSLYPTESEPWDIYVMNVDGTNVQNITEDEAVDGFPRWSPDGHRIAYDSYMEHLPRDLWIINADGSGKRQLTETDEGFSSSSPAWSPDGTRIAFVRSSIGWGLTVCGDGQPTGIYVVNTDGSGVRQITSNACDAYPAWSPDGTKIAFVRNQDLHVMNADGKGVHMLSECVPCQNVGVPDQHPVWSMDGNEISFVRLSQIYVVNANGTNVRKIPSHGTPPPIYVEALDRGRIRTGPAAATSEVGASEQVLHTDPMHGWSLRVARPLRMKPYRVEDRGHREDALVANYPVDAVEPENAVASLPAHGVLFMFEHAWSGAGPVHEPGNETLFPLSLEAFTEIATPDPARIAKALHAQVLANGSVFDSRIWIGLQAPGEDVERISRTVQSLEFPPLVEGTATGDDFYVLEPADAYKVGSAKRFTGFSADYPTGIDFFFLVRAPGGFYGVEAAAPATRVLLSLDRDRFEFGWEVDGARWNRLGELVRQPVKGQAERNLNLYLARVAHDGHVIVRFLDPVQAAELRSVWG